MWKCIDSVSRFWFFQVALLNVVLTRKDMICQSRWSPIPVYIVNARWVRLIVIIISDIIISVIIFNIAIISITAHLMHSSMERWIRTGQPSQLSLLHEIITPVEITFYDRIHIIYEHNKRQMDWNIFHGEDKAWGLFKTMRVFVLSNLKH